MPIIVQDYDWNQSGKILIIKVPSRGVAKSKIDIFYSPRYIKVNYDPFFFEIVLAREIDPDNSKCTITDKEMVFELLKIDTSLWDELEPNISKKEKMELKLKLIQDEYENIRAKEEEKKTKKSELKRLAVQEQLKIDERTREGIAAIKKQEENEALGDLKSWQSKLDAKTIRKKKKKLERYIAKKSREVILPDILPDEDLSEMPIPRSTKALEVDFTLRSFPTPIRESKIEEENEWLKKQAEARRSVGFDSEDIRPEEKNPMFLLQKGNDFMNNSNYLGAISAYSFGIKLSDKFADLYVARSKAHYLQENYHKCAVDCSKALELMEPKVEGNLKQRAECIGRRGMALCKFKMLSRGIGELEASLKLQPNEEYECFLKEAEKEWMNTSDSD